MKTTKALIPTNGVHISETRFPKGFYVATYDHEGFVSEDARWFDNRATAEAYAAKLQ